MQLDIMDTIKEDEMNEVGGEAPKKGAPDMKNILGYLNQGEWTTALSIGSIMQLQPVMMKDLLVKRTLTFLGARG